MVKLPDILSKVVKQESLRANSTRIVVGYYTASVMTPLFDPKASLFYTPVEVEHQP